MKSNGLSARRFASALLAAFACAAGAGGGEKEAARARIASLRAEEIIPHTAIGLVAVRDISKAIEKARSLGAARIIEKLNEKLDLGRMMEGPVRGARKRLEGILAMLNITPDDIAKTFRGSAFGAVLGFVGDPPMIPELLVWIETKEAEPRVISAFLSFLKGVALGQGGALDEYEYKGGTISAVDTPMLPVPLCWSYAAGGFAFSLGRGPVEDLVARAAGLEAAQERPSLGRLSDLPAVKELLLRLGGDEDLIALFSFPRLLRRLGERFGEEDRRGLAALGLDSAVLAYGLKIISPEGEDFPGGVKEVALAWSAEKRGALRLLDLPVLENAPLAREEKAIFGIEAALDARALFADLRELVRNTEGEEPAGELTAAVGALADAMGLTAEETLEALSGRLRVVATSRPEGFIPDAGLVFETKKAPELAAGLRRALPRLEGVELRSGEFMGAGIASLVFEAEDVPAVISPSFTLDGGKLLAAVSTQSMKRLITRTRTAAAAPETIEQERPGEAGAILAALSELSPGASFILAIDLARAGAIAFDVMSFIPGGFGRGFRRVFDRLPPVEEILDDLGGAALALYSLPEGAAVEVYSPTGQLPLWTGVAATVAMIRAGRGGREAPRPEPVPPAEPEPDEEGVF